ncbi:hypothetical protein SH467x_000986 [Pirellulaceae bacterium SH467]|jgi:hypothetical protein
MAKFYVQSGSLRGIVDCFDEECAAVWAVHRIMLRVPESVSLDLLASDIDDGTDAKFGEAMFELDETIRVSEQGFDREDASKLDLHHAFVQWHQLKKAIDAISKNWDRKLGE